MSIISWIVLGLIAGFIGSKLVNKTARGSSSDIALGIVEPLSEAGYSACSACTG